MPASRPDELLSHFPGYVLRRTADDMMSEFAMERIPAEHRDHFLPALYALWRPAENGA